MLETIITVAIVAAAGLYFARWLRSTAKGEGCGCGGGSGGGCSKKCAGNCDCESHHP